METKSVKSIFLVGLKLLLICAVVAGVVSFVYAKTEEPYQENINNTKREAVEAIFEETGLETPSIGDEVYKVLKDGKIKGYCAKGVGAGFNGDVELMIGYDESFSIKGVSVISNSETPGVGSNALEDSYLDAYKGQSGEDVEVDAYAGAAYTSKGVREAVRDATERLKVALGLN